VTEYDSGTLLFRNTMRVTDGHLDAFRRAIARAVGFAREHGPQLMVEVFIDEERMLAYSFQLYRDSDAVRLHQKLSDPYIREVMDHCTVEYFEVFGDPDDEVRASLKTPDGASFPVGFASRVVGFHRLAGSEEPPGS
jgi:hypothetical protein